MASFGPTDFEFGYGDISTATGAETLAGNGMTPEEFATSSSKSQPPKRMIGGREFLVVGQWSALGRQAQASGRPP
jgi:hypothetical protein